MVKNFGTVVVNADVLSKPVGHVNWGGGGGGDVGGAGVGAGVVGIGKGAESGLASIQV